MPRRLLVANRSEIACRVIQTASRMGVDCVAAHSSDDSSSAHVAMAAHRIDLGRDGPAAYLDVAAIVEAAVLTSSDAVHPGYGFLSESEQFVRQLEKAGVGFVGPTAETIALLGNKTAARTLARSVDVPVIDGPQDAVSLEEAREFFSSLPEGSGAMLKAVVGGGGRGIRPVGTLEELDRAYAASAAEAEAAFGEDALFIERHIRRARHIEVQLIGDGTGSVAHLWDRDCSIQRQNQKLIEVAPAPYLPDELRKEMQEAALRIAREVRLRSLATVEFLVEAETGRFYFLEANPRIQVEHTVTEEITGLDLVRLQLLIHDGASLEDLGLTGGHLSTPNGYAIQLRLNAESLGSDAQVLPSTGIVTTLRPASGLGIRFDTGLREGDRISGRFDSLLAKLIVHGRGMGFLESLGFAAQALDNTRLSGVDSNASLLRILLARPEMMEGTVDTELVSRVLVEIGRDAMDIPDSTPHDLVVAPLTGLLTQLLVEEGDWIDTGDEVAIMEAMKMEYPVIAGFSGRVVEVLERAGDMISEGAALLRAKASTENINTDIRPEESPQERPDFVEWQNRMLLTEDAARPDAVARRHERGLRTARENIESLCIPGSFREIGALAIAAQRTRRDIVELRQRTPADGMVAGIGQLRGTTVKFAVFAYDETVLSGTQSIMNHKKLRRLLAMAERNALPLVGCVAGGGGRAGDVDDATRATGLDMTGFLQYARLQTPRIAVASGLCFAGNAVLAGTSDVVIATRHASIGMAGPAMIEAAGMGASSAENVGPAEMHASTGTIDILVETEEEASAAAHAVLACLANVQLDFTAPDPAALRHVIPLDRRRAYDVAQIIESICDEDSIIPLGAGYARAMTTALARIAGRPVGVLANNPAHFAGAIGSEEARKATRFLRLCDRFGLPVVSFCDTPGFSVGTETETTGLVRASGDLLNVAGNMTVPLVAVVLRRAYGLGAMAMTAGSFHAPTMTVSWPSGEFGGMGPEGFVRLGYRKELDAEADPLKRQALFDKLLAEVYENGKAIMVGESLEVDAVVDPADTRSWIISALDTPLHDLK